MRTGFLTVGLFAIFFFSISRTEAAEPKVLLSSKVATDGDFLTLPVMIDGEKHSFMVDTGASSTILDPSFHEKLVEVGGSDEKREVRPGVWSKFYHPPSMTIMGTEAGSIKFPTDLLVWSVDLSIPNEASDQAIDGVLGMDFLENYALELDLAAGTLRLLDSSSLKVEHHDGFLHIRMVNRSPTVLAASRDIEFWALIDTGALLVIDLQREAYDHLAKERQLWPWPIEFEEAGNKQLMRTGAGWLRELRVGPFTHRFLAFIADRGSSGSLLGLYYWRRYHVTFDFPRKLVYFDKGPLFDVFDDSHHAGLYIQPVEGNEKVKVVTHIVKGCFAERNGVQVGDHVLAIDGNGVEDSSVHNIQRRLSFRHDRECVLRLSRDSKEFDVTLPPSGLMPQLNDDAK